MATWKALIRFCLRVSELPENQRADLYGIEFTDAQFQCLQEFYTLCLEAKIEDEEIDTRSLLVEKLFQFVLSLICQQFPQEEEPRSPICYFTGVLGINREKRGFRPASNYTKDMAGMIWISRLLLLEYALPKYPYEHLGFPDRKHYPKWGWRLEDIRREHMLDGTDSPFNIITRLLKVGRKIGARERMILLHGICEAYFRTTRTNCLGRRL